jgi:hypothetical protein
MQKGKRKSPAMQGIEPDLNKNLSVKIRKKPYRKSQAVKELERLATNAARQKFPEIPAEWLAPRKYRDDTANGLTKCIIHFLKFKGQQAERISNTGRLIDNQRTFTNVVGQTRTIGQKKWIKGTGTKGTADISATIARRSVKIEVKIGTDRQSQVQKDYQQAVEQAGGIYVIARTFGQFYDWYNEKFESDES